MEWGENKKNISDIGIALKDITMVDIEQFMSKGLSNELNNGSYVFQEPDSQIEYSQKDHPSNKLILRHLNSDFSIRKGKFGNYVYHKTAKMKTPTFYKIKDFSKSLNALTCDEQLVIEWLIQTYNIE